MMAQQSASCSLLCGKEIDKLRIICAAVPLEASIQAGLRVISAIGLHPDVSERLGHSKAFIDGECNQARRQCQRYRPEVFYSKQEY